MSHAPDLARRPARSPTKNMVWVPGGIFWMGSEEFYVEERPVHQVGVDGFWMDEHPVTVGEFRRFVKATGHVTTAERSPDVEAYSDVEPDLLVPGSLVFRGTPRPVPLNDFRRWWRWTPDADWRHPEGPGSTVNGRERHPVTHVSYADAVGYARWAGKDLASEAEWEFAARGGLDRARFAWGDEELIRGRRMANTWQGAFPWQNLLEDGYFGTSPVGAFPPNPYGLLDITGNVWEWTSDQYTGDHTTSGKNLTPVHGCCVPHNPRVSGKALESARESLRVIKGGSHLCAPSYCLRYRPAARQAQSEDSSTSHLGFRCVIRAV